MIATALLVATLSTGDLATFHIGNSLTWDAQPNLMPHTTGYHILCGRGLATIWENPTETCVTPPFGTYQDALANQTWTHVFIQPFYGSTLDIDAAFIRDVHQRSPDARIVIYETWTDRTIFEDTWLDPWAGGGVQIRRAYYDSLSAELSDVPHDRLRVGDIFYSLSNEMDLWSLFRDDVHLGLSSGRYIPHAATHHYLTGTFPAESPLSADLSSEQIHSIHSVIASVPEPSSFIMLLLVTAVTVCCRRFRSTSCR